MTAVRRSRTPAVRALTRIARRDAWHHPGRSALVLVLVLLPVAGLVVLSSLVRTVRETPDQVVSHRMGTADLLVTPDPTRTGGFDIGAAIGPEGRSVRIQTVPNALLPAPGQILYPNLTQTDLRSPLVRGLFAMQAGRGPTGPGEAAVSPSVLTALRAAIGDRVTLRTPPVTLRVTGEVVDPQQVDAELVVTGPGRLPARGAQVVWLVADGPRGPSAVAASIRRAGGRGVDVLTRAQAITSQGTDPALALGFAAAGLALFGAGLVAAAAFGVGVRRQLRSFGLLEAAGAERRHLGGMVLLGGALLGLLGAVGGVAFGVTAAVLSRPLIGAVTNRLIELVVVRPADLGVAAALGLLCALGAAFAPARSASRIPAVEALAGRRPLSPPSGRLTVAGLATVAGGVAAVMYGAARPGVDAVAVAGGSAAIVAGFTMCGPAVITVMGRVAGRLPMAPRFAVRDAVRSRARSGPAVAAVMATLALTVALSAFVLSQDKVDGANYRPLLGANQLLVTGASANGDPALPSLEAARTVAAAIPGARVAVLSTAWIGSAATGGGSVEVRGGMEGQGDRRSPVYSPLAVGDADLLSALGGAQAKAAFDRGTVVGIGSTAVAGRTVVLTTVDASGKERSRIVPAVSVTGEAEIAIPRFAVSTRRATALGLKWAEQGWLIRSPLDLTPEEITSAVGAAARIPQVFVQSNQAPPKGHGALRLILLVATGLIALATTGALSALSAAETRPEVATLVAVGASPRTRRTIASARAGVIVGLGGVLAIPAGMLPAVAVLAVRRGHPIVIPWATFGAVGIALPVLAMSAAWALSRSPAELVRPGA